jgi:hypothetical protein
VPAIDGLMPSRRLAAVYSVYVYETSREPGNVEVS